MGRRNDLNQVFVSYWKWECYKSGMWSKGGSPPDHEKIMNAVNFMKNSKDYGHSMREVSKRWKNSMLNFLTNNSINKNAYIGHCAVFYKLGITENVTRLAWKKLTEKEMYLANQEAEKTIKEWELNRKYNNTLVSGKTDATQEGFQMKLLLK